MKQASYYVINSARDGIDELDRIRRDQGISQMRFSEMANIQDVATQYFRMYKSGDVTLGKFLRYLKAIGFRLVMIKGE